MDATAARPRRRTAPRLVQLCNFPRREGGSFIPFIVAVLAAAKDRGWDVAAVFSDPGEEMPWLEEFEGRDIPVEIVASPSRRGRVRALAGMLPGDGPAILHTHFTSWDMAAVAVARRRPDTHVFWHVHSTLPDSPTGWLRNVAKLVAVGRSVDRILCPAENIVDDVRARFGPRERVLFFPSAIELASFPAVTSEDRERARIELGLPQDATVLLHFGWHWHLKGGDLFLDTVRGLLDDGVENLVALERGGGERARAEAGGLGIAGRLTVVEPLPSVRPLFAASDVLVSSSRSEGMAYSVLEALASGIPVVATRIPGHTFLGDSIDACRTVDTDPASLAAGVRATLERPSELVAAEREQASSWLRANLSTEVLADRLLDLYTSAL